MTGDPQQPSAAAPPHAGMTEAFRRASEDGDHAIYRARSLADFAHQTAINLPGTSRESVFLCVLLETLESDLAAIEAAHRAAWESQGGK